MGFPCARKPMTRTSTACSILNGGHASEGRATRWSIYKPGTSEIPHEAQALAAGRRRERSWGGCAAKRVWERISWDEAIEMSAARLKRIAETYGTDATDNENGLPILNLCYTSVR